MAEEKIILQVDIDASQTEQSITELTGSIIGLKKAQIDLNSAVKKGEISEVEYQKEIEKSKEDISKLNAERKNEIKILKAAENSIEALEAAQAKLVKQRKTLNLSTTEGIEQYKQLSAQIKLNQGRLTSYGEDIDRHQSKVGNYKGAILEAFESLNLFDSQLTNTAGTFIKTASGAGKATTAMRIFKIALAATGIGLIIIALTTLYNYFTKFDSGMEKIEKAAASAGAVFTVFFERVIEYGKQMLNYWLSVFDILTGVGQLIAGIVTLDYSNITKGLESIKSGGTGVKDSVVGMIDAFKGMGAEMVEDGKKAAELKGKLQELEDTERNLNELRAKQGNDLKNARRILNDVDNFSAKQRYEAILKVGAAEKELAEKETKYAKDKYNVLKEMSLLRKDANEDEELRNKISEAYIEIQNLEAASDGIIAKNLAQQKALRAELNKELEKELQQKNALEKLKKLSTETQKADVVTDEEQKAIDSVKAADAAMIDSANQRESALISNAIEGADKRDAIRKEETEKAIAENERLLNNIIGFSERTGDALVGAASEADATIQSVLAATAEALIKEIETYAVAQLIKLVLKQTADAASLNIPGALAAGAGIIAIKAASAGIRAQIRSSVAPSAPASVPNVASAPNLNTINRQFSSQQNINVAAPNVNVSTSAPSASEIGNAVAKAVQNVPIYVSVTDINEAQTMQVKVTNNGRI